MERDELVTFICNDISGLTRGRAISALDLDARLRAGVGWVPLYQALSCFGEIAEDNPWGPIGDLRLKPDPETKVRVEGDDEAGPLHVYLCDIVDTEGKPWGGCLRTLLRKALATLEHDAGLKIVASFEQEFYLLGVARIPEPAFSLSSLRATEPFCTRLYEMTREAGLHPELLHPELGPDQFELLCRPAVGVAAADRAVIMRELVRETARRLGGRASFAPMRTVKGWGCGVHLHFSFRNAETGEPVGFDPDGPGGCDPVMGSFAAGVLRHLPALCALTAPSVASYLRLVPRNLSAAYNVMGLRNRAAALRICPTVGTSAANLAQQFNLEYRVADGTASPYLVLAMLILAGLQGLHETLPMPRLIDRDPADMRQGERDGYGIRRLPGSLAGALAALEADPLVRSWLNDDLMNGFMAVKRAEQAAMSGARPEEICERYLAIY